MADGRRIELRGALPRRPLSDQLLLDWVKRSSENPITELTLRFESTLRVTAVLATRQLYLSFGKALMPLASLCSEVPTSGIAYGQ